MSAHEFNAIYNLSSRLARAKKNHVEVDDLNGPVQRRTSNRFGRWTATLFLKHRTSAADANRRLVDQFVARVKTHDVMGDRLGELVAGKLSALRASGKPLSGRVAANALTEAALEVRNELRAIRDNESRLAQKLDIVANRFMESFVEAVQGPPGNALDARRAEILAAVRERLPKPAPGPNDPPMPVDLMIDALRDALLDDHLKRTDLGALFAAELGRLGLDPNDHPFTPDDANWIRAECFKEVEDDRLVDGDNLPDPPDMTDLPLEKCRARVALRYLQTIAPRVEARFNPPAFDGPALANLNALLEEKLPGFTLDPRAREALAKSVMDLVAAHYASQRPPPADPAPQDIDRIVTAALRRKFRHLDAFEEACDGLTDPQLRSGVNALMMDPQFLSEDSVRAVAGAMKDAVAALRALGGHPSPQRTQQTLAALLERARGHVGDFDPDDAADLLRMAFDGALRAAIPRWGAKTAEWPHGLGEWIRPGSPFLDAVDRLSGDDDARPALEVLLETMRSLGGEPRERFPRYPGFLAALELPLRPEHLSVGRLREIHGPDVFVVGDGDGADELNDLIRQHLPAWRDNIEQRLAEDIDKLLQSLNAPSDAPDDPRWLVRGSFLRDMNRNGVLVGDQWIQFHDPSRPAVIEALNSDGFVEAIGSRRNAALASVSVHQGLGADVVTSAPTEIKTIAGVAFLGQMDRWLSSNTDLAESGGRMAVTLLPNGDLRVTRRELRAMRDPTLESDPRDIDPDDKAPLPPYAAGAFDVTYDVRPGPPPEVLNVTLDVVIHKR